MAISTSNRLVAFDFLRAFAITGVVYIHLNGGFWGMDASGSLSWWLQVGLISAVYLGVPLFILVSGALLISNHQPLL